MDGWIGNKTSCGLYSLFQHGLIFAVLEKGDPTFSIIIFLVWGLPMNDLEPLLPLYRANLRYVEYLWNLLTYRETVSLSSFSSLMFNVSRHGNSANW